jgi:hypothetical protein
MLVGTAAPARAAGLTSAQINAIIGLLQSFGADQSVISNVQVALGGTSNTGSTQAFCHTFNKNLRIGDFDSDIGDVYALHQTLIREGFSFPGKPTLGGLRSYDEEAASVVTEFQEKYASDILTPNGLQHGTGYVGAATRAKLNALYGCGTTTTQVITKTTSAGPFPPSGWYLHNSSDIPTLGTVVMLTRQKTYPSGYCEGTEGACYGEQIGIRVSATTLTAETYVANIIQDGVYPSTKKWDVISGYKMFSMTYVTDANTTKTDAQYLFAAGKVYQFSLYPSAEKDSSDFQQVVNYYVAKGL